MSEGFYTVVDKKIGLVGLKNKDGTLLIPCMYTYLSPMSDGLLIYANEEASKHTLEGFLDKNGNVMIEAQFLELWSFEGELAQFNPRNGFTGGYVTKEGKVFYGKDYLDGENTETSLRPSSYIRLYPR